MVLMERNVNAKPRLDSLLDAAAGIESKPVEHPDYTRALGTTFAKWLAVNDLDLNEYFRATSQAGECTFIAFARCQYDVQCEIDEEEDEYVESGEAYRDRDNEPSDADDDYVESDDEIL
jgi:hypothetical protein